MSYLRLVILLAAAGLLVLPWIADAGTGLVRPAGDAAGCRVVSVIDGDTVTLWCRGRAPERARLTGFDAPELFSPGCASELALAWQAKWQLRMTLWTARDLRIVTEGHDRYGRRLAAAFADGTSVAGTMIGKGLARPYSGGARGGWCG